MTMNFSTLVTCPSQGNCCGQASKTTTDNGDAQRFEFGLFGGGLLEAGSGAVESFKGRRDVAAHVVDE